MDERSMWGSLQPRLAALGLDPVRIENALNRGTPDVNYTHGWIELKSVERWPVHANHPLRLPALMERPEQVAWLTRRWAAGGAAWLMLRVGRDLLLFSGLDARTVRLGQDQARLRELACWTLDTQHPTLFHWQQLG